ncbi:uncharacterized protein [Physcomitrium patens]|uniref:Pentacotripeptide-repeat region of PRORP domain-containing protein n=2 Tax=Physcomitrium patens TaxID=3218 RepID=A0A7I4DWS8_PHYPA|nr:pentatricopeptide repeat-containing protein At4g39620, chloroplastic-like isoform X2 [Physcomitrium patens]XP_024373046.1 pentatricopeptide repeat-containing protein At4g39620, chloroplastic-like isoform X2 [Physcomitrium patens]|eukprot:XP_024373045.1 pentatricopeptide repeat-containing protein At4g39620, chloroplastic-like isoform X2 [Physcomitrella patens]
MASSLFIPTQSLLPTREFFVALPRMLPRHYSLVIHAAKRSTPNATPPVHRPSITSIVKTLTAGHVSVVQALQRQAPYMRQADWFALLAALGKQSKWTLILETFRWMQEQKWYRLDNGFHSKLIVTMGKAKQLRMAVWFFKEVKRNGHRPDTSLYNALITAHLQAEDKRIGFAKALQLFEEMKTKANCKPDLVTYNILLRGSAQVRDILQVERFFEEMEVEKIHPNLISYNGVIGAYGKAGDLVQMEKTLFTMRILKHIKPDTVTSNTLIESYGYGRDFVKMEQVFKSMTAAKNKQTSRPDAKTYNILMASYARLGEVGKMEWSCSRMEAANFKLNLRSYEILMTGYGEVGAIASMSECFYQMLQAGMQPQKSTLNAMLRAYCKHNCFEEAEELLNDALGWQTRPRTSSYLILLRAYAKERRSSDVEMLTERMAKVGIAPCAATFLEALESFSLSCGYN